MASPGGNSSGVEHNLAKVGVAGSNPVSRSTSSDRPRQPRGRSSVRTSIAHGGVAKWLRRRSAKPLSGGSNPPAASIPYSYPVLVRSGCSPSFWAVLSHSHDDEGARGAMVMPDSTTLPTIPKTFPPRLLGRRLKGLVPIVRMLETANVPTGSHLSNRPAELHFRVAGIGAGRAAMLPDLSVRRATPSWRQPRQSLAA